MSGSREASSAQQQAQTSSPALVPEHTGADAGQEQCSDRIGGFLLGQVLWITLDHHPWGEPADRPRVDVG